MTRTGALIEEPLNLFLQIAMDFFDDSRRGFRGQTAQCFRMFALKAHQDFLRQRIGKTKSDEIGSTFAFDMRQITARVNAAAKWAGWFNGNTGSA